MTLESMAMEINLFDHQKESLDFLSGRDYAGLFLEQGLGKTLIMLMHIERIKPKRPLVICPTSLTGVWAQEVCKWGFAYHPIVLQGTKKQRQKKLLGPTPEGKLPLHVINYEGLKTIQNELLMHGFDCIVCDESLRIKNPRSQRSKIAYNLGKLARWRYILTGTPISTSPMDIWMQINFLSFSILGRMQCFQNNYCTVKKIWTGREYVNRPIGFKNQGELQRNLRQYCLRKTKKECLDLPDKIFESIPCHMDYQQKRKYEQFKNNLKTVINDGDSDLSIKAKNAQSLFIKLHQIAQGFLFDNDGKWHYFKSSKEEALKDILSGIEKEKVIIWAWYRPDVERIKGIVESMGRRALIIDGNSEERMGIINDFQNCSDPAVFIGQMAKASEGITITTAAYVVYYGNSWSLAHRLQSEDRNHRIGQDRNVTYYDLVTPDTIDSMLVASLRKKKSFQDTVTGDTLRIAQQIVEQ